MELALHENCTCCGSCADACPRNCIEMSVYSNGFFYPRINTQNCIECGACREVCHAALKAGSFPIRKCYAAQSRCDEILAHSSSGGIFTHISSLYSGSGKIIGAGFDSNLNIRHMTSSECEHEAFRGSKYAKSKTEGIFKMIEKYLEAGQEVLFSGTPCQVAAVKTYLRTDRDNLTTCEVFCHGIPSDVLFKKYIEDIQNKSAKRIMNYVFRSKRKCWQKPVIEFTYEDGTNIVRKQTCDGFWMAFANHYSLMESCFKCSYRSKNRVADISIGDFWGIENISQNFEIKKGVSAILVNTCKGEKLVSQIRGGLIIKECGFDDILKGNAYLTMQYEVPPLYYEFWRDEAELTLSNLFKKYCKLRKLFYLAVKLKKNIRKCIKYVIKFYKRIE